MRLAALALVVTLVTARAAEADPLAPAGLGPRAFGRAGVGVVSADDGSALLLNPAGLARRLAVRAQAGLVVVDRSASFSSDVSITRPGLEAEERGGARFAPVAAFQAGLGDRVTLGAALLWPADVQFVWPEPRAGSPTPNARLFRHRYGGTRFALERRGATVGIGVRTLSWLALGVSGHVEHVSLDQRRALWTGDDAPGGATIADLSPHWDLSLALEGSGWSGGATLGFVIAPDDIPIELGASATWSADAKLTGSAALGDARGAASLTLKMPALLRAGARVLASRAAFEVDVEVWRNAQDPSWRIEGLDMPVTEAALGPGFRDGVTLRGAVDVDVVRGFLAVTGGYAYATAALPRRRLSSSWPEGGPSHTASLGVEGRVAGSIVTLGASRTMFESVAISSSESEVYVLVPNQPGLTVAAAGGKWDGAVTTIGLGVEVEWE